MEIQAQLHHATRKADRCFLNAYSSLRSLNYGFLVLEAVKMLVFVVLVPVTLVPLGQPFEDPVRSCLLNVFASGLGLALAVGLAVVVFSSTNTYLSLAEETGHSVEKEPIGGREDLESCTSDTIFLAENEIVEADLDEEGRKLNINIAKNSINTQLRARLCWLRNAENFYQILSFASMIFAIVVLAKNSMPVVDTVFLSLYVVAVALSQLPLLFVCLLVALSPLICLVLMVVCCCRGGDRKADFVDLPAKEATTADIVNAGGDCSICYMSLGMGSKIFVLPCSEKHIFHVDCLRHWAKVKNTCPICRGPIPMTASSPPEAP